MTTMQENYTTWQWDRADSQTKVMKTTQKAELTEY